MLYRLPTTTNNLFAPHSISHVRLSIREMFETNHRLKFNQNKELKILFRLLISEWISKASLYIKTVFATETLVYGAETQLMLRKP